MKYIIITYVDNITKIPVHIAPIKNGPAYPKIKGLNVKFWDESNWPITHPDQYPKFYATCDDDEDLSVSGVMHVFENYEEISAKEQFEAHEKAEMEARLPSVVSSKQIRLALLEMGFLEQVQDLLKTLDEPLKTKALIEWEYSTEINKFSPLVQNLYTKLGMTKDQLNQLFVLASKMWITNLNPIIEKIEKIFK